MAKQTGGLLGRPSGSIAGIVFGSARSRQGKVVTAREKVSPSNPDTADQQTQRNKFKSCLDIVKAIGPSVYQTDWNRAVSQLPGFQSWMSLMLNSMSDERVLSPFSDVSLGVLHTPATFTVSNGEEAGYTHVVWSDELGSNGTDADVAVVITILSDVASDGVYVDVNTDIPRSEGGADLNVGHSGEDYICIVYFRGAGTAEGLLSIAQAGGATIGS